MHRFAKAAAVVVSGMTVTLGVTLASVAPASASSPATCSASFTSYPTIKTGAHGTQVKAAQCLLHAAGYAVAADGSFSAQDSSQLRRFQRNNHVRPSGNLYASSWEALLSRGPRTTVGLGSSGATVQRLQRALTASGRPLEADGDFGPLTRNAVKSLQVATGHRATGKATPSVWRELQYGNAAVAKKTATSKPAPTAPTAPKAKASSKGGKVVSFAKKQLGERYVFGAAGPSKWDCSGLTMKAWGQAGVSLPHQASQQFKMGKHISKANLQPGDLLFYYKGIKHVGVYVGNGKIVDAANPKKGVRETKAFSMPFQGARRMG